MSAIALDIPEDSLLRGVAPAGMAPDFGLAAQTLDRVVEGIDELVDIELSEGLAADRHHMDLRLLQLDTGQPASANSPSSLLSASLIAQTRSTGSL
jgi:hypothetical protein